MTGHPLDMTLDRDLRELFAAGPQEAPMSTLERGLGMAAAVNQRRPRFGRLDRRAWPPLRRSLSDPSVLRLARLAAVALALLLLATLVVVGALLGDRPPTIVLEPAGALTVRLSDPGIQLWPDGRLLVGNEYLFDLATGATSRLDVANARGPSPAVHPLSDGQVMLLYGPNDTESLLDYRHRVALLDPVTGDVTSAGELPPYKWQRAELVLRDGRILMSGGIDFLRNGPGFGDAYATVALFDPATETTTDLAPLLQPRFMHTMLELRDGRILIAGGSNLQVTTNDGLVTEVEVYDLRTQRSKVVGEITVRSGYLPLWVVMAQLADGRVVISGRVEIDEPCGNLPPPSGMPLGTPSAHAVGRHRTHVFDPARDTLREGPLVYGFLGAAVPLTGDRVLLAFQARAFPDGCASDANAVEYPWLGVVDFGTGVTFESRNPVTGVGAVDVLPDTYYSGGVRLPDGRVALVEAGQDSLQPNEIDLLIVDP